MIESAAFAVTVVAAIVYLIAELLEFGLWRRRRRERLQQFLDRPPGLGDTWPDDRREEAEENWRQMLEDRES